MDLAAHEAAALVLLRLGDDPHLFLPLRKPSLTFIPSIFLGFFSPFRLLLYREARTPSVCPRMVRAWFVGLASWADLRGDRRRGRAVVAGDHEDTDLRGRTVRL